MSVVFVTEKPYVARRLAPYMSEWALARGENDVHSICSLICGMNVFLDYAAVPVPGVPEISMPVFGMKPFSEKSWCHMRISPNGIFDVEPDFSPEILRDADHVVFAADPDYVAVHVFTKIMEKVFGAGVWDERRFPAVNLFSLADADMSSAMRNTGDFLEMFSPMLGYAESKRFLDWNWNRNSSSLLSAFAAGIGLPFGEEVMSKNTLQLMYRMRKMPSLGAGSSDLLSMMSRWKSSSGTIMGRLGSVTSMSSIMDAMDRMGVADNVGSGRNSGFFLNARGVELLMALPPCFEDEMLPKRIDDWGKMGANSFAPISEYLLERFGSLL